MLTRLLTRLRREHRGFTLVETLVAMVTGIVVTGALFAILEVSLHQEGRLSDVAQATQLGRTTMTRVVDEMHSACISEKFTPVQEGSTANKLILINGYSEGAEVPVVATSTSGVRKDIIELNPATGILVDGVFLSTKETSTGVFSYQTVKSVRIGEDVSQTEELVAGSKTTKYKLIFKYFEYSPSATAGTKEASSSLTPILPKAESESLTEAQAKKVAAVEVSFVTAPNDKQTTRGRTATLNSLVTFAFSAPDSEATITGGPCE
ncbi:MAG TPA: prepilin-type N-terminal cleavage/methylation domain-containing protein [Solirubrobacteraceae bacterium]|jgi:type II secretory pathway pseudopilin PulG